MSFTRMAALILNKNAHFSDAELVGRYVADRDEQAFEVLVQRHGPAVLAVCQKALGNSTDADDAFQATFLVLIRKAHRVTFQSDIASWLFGVAMRASHELLRQQSRQRSLHSIVTDTKKTAAPPSHNAEDCQILLDEIAKLAETYRSPVVLCELAGVSRRDAARQLGIPEGTLSSRLADARKRLKRRLQSRGVVAGVGLLAVPVPSALAAKTIRLATNTDFPSPAVIQLMEAIMQTSMSASGKLLMAAAVILTVVGLTIGGEPTKSNAGDPVAKDVRIGANMTRPESNTGPNRIYSSRDGRLYTLDINGENEQRIPFDTTEPAGTAQPSPDGHLLAYWQTGPKNTDQVSLVFADGFGKLTGERITLPRNGGYRRFCWSPDGSQIHVSQSCGKAPKGGVEHFTIDVKNRTFKPFESLRGHVVTDWSRDGKYFLTTYVGEAERWEPKSIHLMNTDGTPRRKLAQTEGACGAIALSPDGSRILSTIDRKLVVIDVDKPNVRSVVEGIPTQSEVTSAAWTSDGTRILYCLGTLHLLDNDQIRELQGRLVVADPSGKNAKNLRVVTGESFDTVFCR